MILAFIAFFQLNVLYKSQIGVIVTFDDVWDRVRISPGAENASERDSIAKLIRQKKYLGLAYITNLISTPFYYDTTYTIIGNEFQLNHFIDLNTINT